ncbi:MAG TPA: helix-turn-helix domain-containing protein [Gaiellaceae bacterium]|nr:helix-turn-helix domain-containing protein [Gaiellaceae bacterium]
MARRDAERNRAKLIEAGRLMLAEGGPDVPREEIARRAGVGIGTLYRHFPTREALVESIFAEHLVGVRAAAEEAAGAEDAWAGLVGFLEYVLELQAKNLALRGVFLRHGDGRALVEHREQMLPLLGRLVERAKEQGALRGDYAVGDLWLALWSFVSVLEATAAVAPTVYRRHLRILLDGMRAEAATRQEARPLAGKQLDAAIQAFRTRYKRRRAA